MEIPSTSPLQALVLSLMKKDAALGEKIRSCLQQVGIKLSLASFYQLMARMEKVRWVKGKYVCDIADGQTRKRRTYCITAKGCKALNQTLSFYRELM